MAGHDWFRHDEGDGVPQAEHAAHVSSKALGITLIGMVFGVLFVVVLLSLYFNTYKTTKVAQYQEHTRAADPYLAYKAQMETQLNRVEWIDREAGVVRIPVGMAADRVVQQYAGRAGRSVSDARE